MIRIVVADARLMSQSFWEYRRVVGQIKGMDCSVAGYETCWKTLHLREYYLSKYQKSISYASIGVRRVQPIIPEVGVTKATSIARKHARQTFLPQKMYALNRNIKKLRTPASPDSWFPSMP
ncbi:conserved hypothetical protein [Coccidioides posadasii str. Silveira]|uniref:Uncharacterized protein n=2 Tax=Coccidioides posadasii TaxID=199306 RepID=E9D116_COCPS|nr:conserved hypothetical protein [Coccidioides posadasii str. Silveira]KMM73409.1 hypothetical protein CPAG_09698 [Coccidioides posadasii RMSCC 3488]